MKLVLAVVAAAVIAAIAGTVYVGASLREETVVRDPYEAGLRWDAEHPGGRRATSTATSRATATSTQTSTACDLSAGPCTAAAGPLSVTLELAPLPPRTMAHLHLAARVAEAGRAVDGARVHVSFSMRGMSMGESRASLAPAGDGLYVGKAILVRCPSGRADWTAAVTVERPGAAAASAAFPLRVSP